jgi:hypothetical protein
MRFMNTETLTTRIQRPASLRRLGFAFCVLAASSLAQTEPVEPAPAEVTEIETAAPKEAAARVSASFEALAGSEDNAVKLVEGLRAGSEITLTTEIDGQAVQRTFQPVTGEQGYGEVLLSLSLAERELAKAGVTDPTPAQLEAALNGGVITVGTGETVQTLELAGVLNLRAEGLGWGQVARELDLNLGEVVSGVRRDPRAIERLSRRPEFAGKSDLPARPVRIERAQRVERVERVARLERPERPLVAERIERPVRIERVERPVRPERPERPGRP